jgi:GWxTD domain-containing protein
MILLLLVAPALPGRSATRATRAAALYAHAESLLARRTIDTRRGALRELEQAALLDPTSAQIELELARAYYQAGFLKLARLRFEHVVRLAPGDPAGRYGLGQVWRRDWLKYLDRTSLARAVENLSRAARLRPDYCDAWLLLAPLLVEQGDDRAAAAAAVRALDADPGRAEALLATAYTAFRLGRIEHADSAFAAALPRLRKNVRERFDDIAPVASPQDTTTLHHLPVALQAEFVRRFWAANDPDPVTRENEARLEYWARVSQAYFLYYDPRRREWDERGELYVRYGPPDSALYNPVGAMVTYSAGGNALRSRANVVSFGTGPDYPANVLLWTYPGLGMEIVLQDRLLSEYYLLPMTENFDPDPLPDPDSLARRTDAAAMASGRAVFHALPPGVRPLPLDAALARFQGERGPRLIAQAEVPAGPGDSLWAEWVVLDSSRNEVVRAGRTLSPSACDATGRRVADFAADLPPGEYLVGLSVGDGKGGRGVFRGTADLGVAGAGLALSDVMLACGAPDVSSGTTGVVIRPEPNPGARVEGGRPLTAYFEIYHLSPGRNGMSRFQYIYTVRPAEKDTRIWFKRLIAPRPQVPDVSASRAEDNAGPLRRQFVSVPVQSLPAGRYKLEVRVLDLVSNTQAVRVAEFVKSDADARAD